MRDALLESGRGYVDVYGRVYLLLWVWAGEMVVARSGGVTRIFAVIMYPASLLGHHPPLDTQISKSSVALTINMFYNYGFADALYVKSLTDSSDGGCMCGARLA